MEDLVTNYDSWKMELTENFSSLSTMEDLVNNYDSWKMELTENFSSLSNLNKENGKDYPRIEEV